MRLSAARPTGCCACGACAVANKEKSVTDIVERVLTKRKKAMRDMAVEVLDMQRREFEKFGDERVILSGINLCAAHNIPLPAWLARAFTKKFRDVKAFKYSSWDAALGSPHSQGPRQGKRGAGPKKKARQAYKELEIPVWLKVRELDARGIKTTDDVIFKQAANELKAPAGAKKTFHITASTVKRIYYASNHESLETLIYVVRVLRELGGEAEARAYVEAHFDEHPYRDVATNLILNSQKLQK
jgi:hypothetical protein